MYSLLRLSKLSAGGNRLCRTQPQRCAGQLDAQFELSAILPREEIWDTLILKPGAKLHSLTIGTSSVRRVQLVNSYWSGTAKTVSIRGNVHTRLRKLVESPDLDGIILARAG